MESVLIEEVRNHDCLFNTKSRDYRNQAMRQAAWEEIGSNMNTTDAAVRTRWTKLRNAFMNAKKRREKNKKIIPWKLEKEMSFLVPFLDTRSNQSNVPCHQHDGSNSDNEKEEDIEEDEKYSYNLMELPENREHPTMAVKEPNAIKQDSKMSESENSFQEMVQILKLKAARQITRRNLQKPLQEFDEVEMFYLSMAKTAKRLPQLEQAKIRFELCRLISEAEMNQLQLLV